MIRIKLKNHKDVSAERDFQTNLNKIIKSLSGDNKTANGNGNGSGNGGQMSKIQKKKQKKYRPMTCVQKPKNKSKSRVISGIVKIKSPVRVKRNNLSSMKHIYSSKIKKKPDSVKKAFRIKSKKKEKSQIQNNIKDMQFCYVNDGKVESHPPDTYIKGFHQKQQSKDWKSHISSYMEGFEKI